MFSSGFFEIGTKICLNAWRYDQYSNFYERYVKESLKIL